MTKKNNKYLLNFAGRANASSVKNTQLLYKDYNNTNKIDFDQDVRGKIFIILQTSSNLSYFLLQTFIIGSENGIDPKHPRDPILLSLSRWDKNRFNLDVRYPISIMNAFSIALAIFDMK